MKQTTLVLSGVSILALLIGLHVISNRNQVSVAPMEPSDSKPAQYDEPAPPRPRAALPTAPATKATPPAQLSVLKRLLANDTNVFKLSSQQVEEFLARNQTNAESLLAAYNVTADPAFLREAARRYPSNALVLVSLLGNDALPDQRREFLDRFKQVAPENPLGNYLAALDDFKAKDQAQALNELRSAAVKTGFSDYTIERAQCLEELYLGSGNSAGQAKALATVGVQEPTLPGLRDLATEMSALERRSTAVGDSSSAQAIAKLGLGLAANIANAGTRSIATEMLGASIERSFLAGLDPNASYDFLPQPIPDRLAQLQANRQVVLDDNKLYNGWLETADENQLISYFDRVKLYGESAALEWAKGQMISSSRP